MKLKGKVLDEVRRAVIESLETITHECNDLSELDITDSKEVKRHCESIKFISNCAIKVSKKETDSEKIKNLYRKLLGYTPADCKKYPEDDPASFIEEIIADHNFRVTKAERLEFARCPQNLN